MKYLTSKQIRDIWYKFFISKGHYLEPPVPLVPFNDSSLLFINSGVAGIKQYFDGSVTPPYKRLVNIQRAIRTNDIENVGVTSRHHTLFEMLGFFSVGDYFKKEAIGFVFELFTKEYEFDLDKLYITYYPNDIVTRETWLSLGVKESHLFPLESNYWEIGKGPSGPDTEIYYDRGEEYDSRDASYLIANDIENSRYIELLNIVFSQYDADPALPRDEYRELPQKNIDVGGGFERFVSVIQKAETNYETDLFMPIITHLEKLLGVKYADHKVQFRVIADHIRAVVVAINDGANFGSDGRGYVLRRLLRRAFKYANSLGADKPILYNLVIDVVSIYQDVLVFSDIKKLMSEVELEEKRFLNTLRQGLLHLNNVIARSTETISGVDAFTLYDTYGFPLELTVEIAKESNLAVDIEGFKANLEEQKERARAARKTKSSFSLQSQDILDFIGTSQYIEKTKLKATVIGLFKDGNKTDTIIDSGEAIFDLTNFYAESGGQVADIGLIYNKTLRANIIDVRKIKTGIHLHKIEIGQGSLSLGDKVTLEVDQLTKNLTARNHSSAHLLQAALRKILSKDIHQEGSYVDETKMHFDYNYPTRPTKKQLKQIEDEVNLYIYQSIPSKIVYYSLDEAKKRGYIALFNEKYGDTVRTVAFGEISKELCGGTHVKNTKDLGLFVIKQEMSIASNIRRIEATTSINAYRLLKEREEIANNIANKLEVESLSSISEKLDSLIKEKLALKSTLNSLEETLVANLGTKLLEAPYALKDLSIIISENDLSSLLNDKLADYLKERISNYLLILISKTESKSSVIVSCSKDAINKGYNAATILKALPVKGGGKAEKAQGVLIDCFNIEDIYKLL